MKNRSSLLLILTVSACASAVQQSPTTVAVPQTPAEQAKTDCGRPKYTQADVQFMTDMIAHHNQAVVMASWAPTHGARESVRLLAARIDVAQRDEMNFMKRWLRERHEMVPGLNAGNNSSVMNMPEMSPRLMPGMLTPGQMAQLSAAKGPDFDRLFLTYMIQHHTGALTMVHQLLSSPGAAQDALVFRFAADVDADQSTEINRMRTMLAPPTP